MKIISKLLVGATAVAAIAAPAAAQSNYPYYPQQGYPQQTYPQAYPQQAYPGYQQPAYAYPGQPGYGQQSAVGAIINQLLGNRYNVTDRSAVTQCATAAQAQAAAQYRPAYGQPPYGNAYGYQGYGNAMQSARVTGITNVERRRNGLRVTGVMSSGMAQAYGNPGYGYGNQGYNPAYAQAQNDLSFRCNVDFRGAVTNLRITRNNIAYRR